MKIDKWLKWNWTIRILMEGLMEIAFCTIITIMHVKPGTFGSNFNLAFAYGLGFAALLFPVFLLVFYCYRFERMADDDDEEFDEKYGAPYEGLKKTERWSLFYSIWLCFRRISFMIIVLNYFESPSKQLWLVQLVNIVAFVYVAIVQPYDDPFLNRMELFNETANIICVDLLFCFTALVPNHDQRDRVGIMFDAVVLGMIGVHLTFLILG